MGAQVEDEFGFDFDNEEFRLSFLHTHENKCLMPTNEPQTDRSAHPVGYTGTWCSYFDQCIHNNQIPSPGVMPQKLYPYTPLDDACLVSIGYAFEYLRTLYVCMYKVHELPLT